MGRAEVEDMTIRDLLTYCQMQNRHSYLVNAARQQARG